MPLTLPVCFAGFSMMIKSLTKSALRHYLLGLPQQQRLARYSTLVNIRWLKSSLAELKPEVLPEAEPTAEAQLSPDCIQPPASHYHQYRCQASNPLSCAEVVKGENGVCQQCYFPALLTSETRLTGKQGQYQIGESLGRRGIGRLYKGTRLGSEQPVVIQEYLLPDRYFSPTEQRQYQDAFVGLAGLVLADGRIQDLRIVPPLEAINDPSGERSYVVSPTIDAAPTLNRTCAQVGAFNDDAVRDVLNQVLQSLAFLHQQKFSLPSGLVQSGVVHGNLSLDSLLWVVDPRASYNRDRGYVYLTDFALWEKLFDPALADQSQFEPQQDLAALGQVAFFLLNGATVDEKGQPLNPRFSSDWPVDADPALKQFILRLLDIEPAYVSAEAARLALLALPSVPAQDVVELREAEAALVRRPWYRRFLPAFVAVALLTVFGSLAWLLLRSRQPTYAETLLPPCCLDAVNAVPVGDYIYAMPVSAYWYPPFKAVDPEAASTTALSWFGQLATVYPELAFEPAVVGDVAGAIAAVQSGEADFTIVPLTAPLPPDITATTIAYDSLVPVVAFSYPDRSKGLPDELGGRLQLEQLRQIYDGTFDSWQQLRATALPIRRYWVQDPTAQRIFAKRLWLSDVSSENITSGLAGFVDEESVAIESLTPVRPRALPALPMLRQILQDFENDTVGSIGISPLSEALGQCSVYPLSLTVAGETVSPLVFADGQPVGPESDLCDRKGSYFPNAEALREGTYPLSYPLAVVYPFDNTRSDIGKRVAGLLLTQESQRYLQALGMVTAYPLEDVVAAED